MSNGEKKIARQKAQSAHHNCVYECVALLNEKFLSLSRFVSRTYHKSHHFIAAPLINAIKCDFIDF